MTNEQKKPVAITEENMGTVLQTAASGGELNESDFKQLLALMMMKERRLIQKEAELERIQVERDKQARLNSEQYTVAKIETQKNCKHLKGGKTRQRGQQKDPNVFAHTFTDGTPMIKCNSCGAKWFPKDTTEYLHRNGMAIPNWTGIGWREAVELAEESSNKPSASEQFQRTITTSTVPKSEKGAAVPNLQL